MTEEAGPSLKSIADVRIAEWSRSATMRLLGKWDRARKGKHVVCSVYGVAVLAHFAAASSYANSALDAPMVVTQVPRNEPARRAGWDPSGLVRTDWFEGARLVVVSPDGRVQVLSESLASACDPCVSFDGQHLLFAGQKMRGANWRIWEMTLDGRGLRAVSPESMDARSPIYVSTLFTLDSPGPWFTTVFVGQESTVNELGPAASSSLYNMKLDGSELRRLTFNPNHNFDPFQMWDGRVIYAAQRYPHEPGAGGGRISLFAIHVEGADLELYGGPQGRRIQHMPCATERGLVIFVESEQATWDGAGQLACVETRRPFVTYRPLTQDAEHRFLHPAPWRGNRVLVSRRSAQDHGTCGVFGFDADTRQCNPVFDSPEYHDVQAVLVKARNRPDGHSTVVTTTNNFGTFYGLNCYTADAMREAHVKAGEIKRVRFIEGVTREAVPSPPQGCRPGPFIGRRLIGEAPVEADGSFNVEVPADTPILVQTLDERGLALGSCGWIWVKPKETRGCIGCHEDPELIPKNEYVLALRRPSNRLLLPPAQRRPVAFREDIAPILQRHCAASDCHGDKNSPLYLPLTAEKLAERESLQAYETLTATLEGHGKEALSWPWFGRYVDAGRARTSWLVWQLLGTNTTRPWDLSQGSSDDPPREVRPMPPPGKSGALNAEEVRTIIQWVDMGAQFAAPQAPASPGPTEIR